MLKKKGVKALLGLKRRTDQAGGRQYVCRIITDAVWKDVWNDVSLSKQREPNFNARMNSAFSQPTSPLDRMEGNHALDYILDHDVKLEILVL